MVVAVRPALAKLLVRGVALWAGTVVALSAQASPFGALAVSTVTGAFGYAWQQADARSAENAAVRSCSANARKVPDCRVVLVFEGSCAALAMDPRNAAYAQSAASVTEAAAQALAACRAAGQSCKVQKTLCAGG